MIFVVIGLLVVLVPWLLSRANPTPGGTFVGPVGAAAETEWRVVRPLARADARRVLRHPAFVVGVVLTPLWVLAATEAESGWWGASPLVALGLVPLGWLTIIATNLVALRPRRTGADELFGSLPVPQSVRTSALLASAIGPAITATVLAVGAVLALTITRGDELRGSPQWAEIAAGVLIVAGGACVGVAVARWLPGVVFGILAVIVVIILQARFLDVSTWPWNRSEGDPVRFLGFLAEPTSAGDPFLEVRPSGWHLLYLAGLVVVMVAVALARDGLRRPVAGLLVVGVVAVVGAGWMQVRPLSEGREDEMVAYLTNPRAHQECAESRGVEYCAYPGYVGDIPEWRERVEATLARVPQAALAGRDPLRVVQRPAGVVANSDCSAVGFDRTLAPGVAERISPSSLWPADGDVHPPFEEESFWCSEDDVHGFFLGVQTAAWTVGLPPAPANRDRRCTANGQARAVVALWAGAAATPDGERTLRDIVNQARDGGSARLVLEGWDDRPVWGVDYTVADARTALALLKVPDADVRAALERDWLRWTAAGTAAQELTRELEVAEGSGPGLATGHRCP